MPRWTAAGGQKTLVSGQTAAAAEELAYVRRWSIRARSCRSVRAIGEVQADERATPRAPDRAVPRSVPAPSLRDSRRRERRGGRGGRARRKPLADEAIPFDGATRAGVLDQRPNRAVLAAFDVIAGSRANSPTGWGRSPSGPGA